MTSCSCPKCGSRWVTKNYCRGYPCYHRSGRSGGEHLRLTCVSCSYGWNEATLDDRSAQGRGSRGSMSSPRLTFEWDEGAPKLPTMYARVHWRSSCSV